jgi:hypothetical protein
MDKAETALRPGFTPRGFFFAIALSICLHLLLVWHLSNWYQAGWDNLPIPSLRRPLHITIAAPRIQETESQQAPLSEPAIDQSPVKKPQPKKEPIDKVEAEVTPLHTAPSKQTITGTIKQRPVTTAQIKQSAATITRKLAEDNVGEQKQRLDSVSAILERALNKPRETPGIYSQADGTTRVVTENGFTYCIKALDDWRILDPQDNIRTSMYCK